MPGMMWMVGGASRVDMGRDKNDKYKASMVAIKVCKMQISFFQRKCFAGREWNDTR